MPELSKHLAAAVTILAEARTSVLQELDSTELGTVRLTTDSALTSLINRLSHLGGVAIVSAPDADAFPPVSFAGMASPLEAVDAEDLEPGELEKKRYVAKVDSLYAQFDTIAPEGILNAYTIPEDLLVVRGVAKRAGVENYEDAEINLHFLEKVEKAIKQKAADEKEQARLDTELEKQRQIVDLESRLKDVEAKLPQLQADYDEAFADVEKAKDKKKAQAKADGIGEEIAAAKELQVKLTEELNALKA